MRLLLLGVLAMTWFSLAPAANAEPGDPCGKPYNPAVNTSDFQAADGAHNVIDNPYYPLRPGTTFVYDGKSEGRAERGVLLVTHDTKVILGVTTTVIRDEVTIEGKRVELTYDWYAQDDAGNVWYFGEYSTDYDENGKVSSHQGSWEAGVDGAKPGIVMQAQPTGGDVYRQEYYRNEAEDVGAVIGADNSTTVPFGTFNDVLQTKETSCIAPLQEYKYYAPGSGLILAKAINSDETLELVEVRTDYMPGALPPAGGGWSAKHTQNSRWWFPTLR